MWERRKKRKQAEAFSFEAVKDDAVRPLRDIALSVIILTAATLIGFLFLNFGFTEANITTVYILGVLIISVVTTSRVCGIAASFVSVVVFNFFFTVPRYTFLAYDKSYPLTFGVMFVAAVISGDLAARLKANAAESARYAYRTKVLFDTNQLLQKAHGSDEIIDAAANQMVKLLNRDVALYTAVNGGLGEARVYRASEEGGTEQYSLPEERLAALRAFNGEERKTTGKCSYIAIEAGEHVYGVAGIAARGDPMDLFERSVLMSIAGECALALENDKNAREKEEAAIFAENERLRANLLRAISHDLRTPLTSISGNASNLLSNPTGFDEATRQQIYTDIYDDSMWLINLVENLLAVTRIEEGRMDIRLSAELIDEVVSEALRHVNRKSAEHNISVSIPDELLLARMDARLIVQVVINLVDNAVKYTPAGSNILICAVKDADMVKVSIADDGPGIPDEIKPRVFEMFFSGANKVADSRRSLGLGLSLCRAIVNAHGGEISVADNAPKGAVFTFTLPSGEVELHE